ncbi:MAG: ATP-binding protein, partial [Gammaproteobacteria bacterium]|nr:ATP-binding protein [Gammaproteobacteria bacterium]
ATPLVSSNEKLLGMIVIINDSPIMITDSSKSILPVFGKRISMELEQRETTKSLHEYQDHLESLVFQRTKELEQAYRDLESYSYSIAHDLRAPLRSITSFSQILQDDLHGRLDEGEADFLNRIIKSSQFMAELISDILELSRITRSEINMEDIDLSELVRTIIDEKIQLLPERTFQIRVTDNVHTKGDPKLFHVLVDNLIENAIKFSRHREISKITFACQENTDGRLICYIKDNGAGFNSDYKEKLFTPFQRLHKREEFEGTGIGLATVKRILERHNGDIWVEAEVDKGACFYFICPDLRIENK